MRDHLDKGTSKFRGFLGKIYVLVHFVLFKVHNAVNADSESRFIDHCSALM